MDRGKQALLIVGIGKGETDRLDVMPPRSVPRMLFI